MANAKTLPTVAAVLVHTLEEWKPVGQDQSELRAEYVSFISAFPGTALDRDGGPEHVTASCFVFTPDLERVLLCFHKKGRFWVQLGGHIEPSDESVSSAAFREAREECGIDDIRQAGAGVLDVDRHSLGDGFTRCGVHWDVGFGAIAGTGRAPSASAESDDVAWWRVGALPDNVPPNFGRRLRRILDAIRNQGGVESCVGFMGAPRNG
jgi:8-oxo-dGTP pyrophosphatase MutT (NUDIX family)